MVSTDKSGERHGREPELKTSRPFLPYGCQTIDADDIAAVAEALKGAFLTTGPAVEAFETSFSAATGATHSVACNSGTAGLHLAVLAVGLKSGDAAIVPSVTFLSTANVVRMCGAEVVFADVDPDTGLLTPQTLKDALTRVPSGLTPRVALPVHLNGRVCDMPALAGVAEAFHIHLIEDACHALGAPDIGASTHSTMTCFSTHPVKAIATGEGGVVTTNDPTLAKKMKLLRNHGMSRDVNELVNQTLALDGPSPNPWYYEMSEIGWNYRLPDPLCALGISQLTKLERFQRRRAEIAALYDKLLAPLAPTITPVSRDGARHGLHIYAILIDYAKLGLSRRQVMELLRAAGVGTQVHYLPIHHQPYYQKRYGSLTLPGADAYYNRCLSIPLFPTMIDDDVRHVARSLANLS